MSRYIKTMTESEWQTLKCEPHPILALPKDFAEINPKDTVLFYQKKVKKRGGLVVGAGTVEHVIHISLNEDGRIGPPKALLRFWAEHIVHAEDVICGLNELGDYELPNYKVGTVLDWMWSIPLIQYVKKTGTWPDLHIRSRVTGFPQMECVRREEDLRAKIVACERWLSRCGLIDNYGGYKTADAVAILEWPVSEFQPGRPLSCYNLLFAPAGFRKLSGEGGRPHS